MAPPSRPPVPLGEPRRRWIRSRRVSALAVVATVLALGGAVAAVYTTGVTLGARIAPSGPSGGGPVRSGVAEEEGAGGGSTSTSTTTRDEDGSLPDRAEGEGPAGTSPGSSTTDGTSGQGSGTAPGTDPVEPYPGIWPYVTWQEVLDHTARGDTRYRTPTDTALRFASDVVGLTGASVGVVVPDGVRTTVEIRSGRGTTLVLLTNATPGPPSSATPWSVVEATGAADLAVPATVSGAALRATTSGSPGIVGVHDRRRWRGIGVAPTPGAAFDVRVDPGASGPAIAIAVAGDPREPTSFTVRRIQLAGGSGAAAAPAPADPVAATGALVDAVGRGDVGATWELLDPAARRSVLDWRGLAGRLPALRDQLGLFASGSLTTTSVTTPVGTVAVVAPAVGAGAGDAGPLAALAFRVDGGARLASTEGGSASWKGPTAADPSVVATGPTRPLALVVDGAVWSSTPDGVTGLRASAATLAPGAHLAIAVIVRGEQVTASAYRFDVSLPPATPEDPVAPDGPSTEPRSDGPVLDAPASSATEAPPTTTAAASTED